MALPRRISPAARARRALLVDATAAIVLAAIVLSIAAGLGVVGFFGLPLLALGLLWIGTERPIARSRSRQRAVRRGSSSYVSTGYSGAPGCNPPEHGSPDP